MIAAHGEATLSRHLQPSITVGAEGKLGRGRHAEAGEEPGRVGFLSSVSIDARKLSARALTEPTYLLAFRSDPKDAVCVDHVSAGPGDEKSMVPAESTGA